MSSVVCEHGHMIELPVSFAPPEEIIAAIAWCQLEVAKPEHGGIIIPCAGRTVWKREHST